MRLLALLLVCASLLLAGCSKPEEPAPQEDVTMAAEEPEPLPPEATPETPAARENQTTSPTPAQPTPPTPAQPTPPTPPTPAPAAPAAPAVVVVYNKTTPTFAFPPTKEGAKEENFSVPAGHARLAVSVVFAPARAPANASASNGTAPNGTIPDPAVRAPVGAGQGVTVRLVDASQTTLKAFAPSGNAIQKEESFGPLEFIPLAGTWWVVYEGVGQVEARVVVTVT